MPGYIYLPVPTQEMLNFADQFRDSQNTQGKERYSILHNYESGWRKGFTRAIGLGVLRNVAAKDKLYVISHGATMGSRFTGARRGAEQQGNEWKGGEYKKYSPAQLAQVIHKEGLTTSFVRLYLFICGSGLVPANQAKSFAEGLATELGGLGYGHIRVVGYLGEVSADKGFGVLRSTGPRGGGYYPLNENMVAYGPNGGQVPIPALMDAGV
jgi:hypothetical protein